jgi:hypothetical protein
LKPHASSLPHAHHPAGPADGSNQRVFEPHEASRAICVDNRNAGETGRTFLHLDLLRTANQVTARSSAATSSSALLPSSAFDIKSKKALRPSKATARRA